MRWEKPTTRRGALQALLADYERIFGTDHPDTVRTRKHLNDWQTKSPQNRQQTALGQADIHGS